MTSEKTVTGNKRVLQNTSVYFTAQMSARALNFVYFLILANALPTDEFGILNYALSVILLIDTFIDMGLSRLAMREMSKYPDRTRSFIRTILPYKIAIGFAVFFGMFAFVSMGDGSATTKAIVIISALSILFTSPSHFLENVMQAHSRFPLISFAHLALSVVQFAVGGLTILLGGQTIEIAMTFALTNFIFFAIMSYGSFQTWSGTNAAAENLGLLRQFAPAFPYLAAALVMLLVVRAELLILGWFGSSEDLGVFSMVTKIVEAGLLFPMALSTVLAPRFAKAHLTGSFALSKEYRTAITVVFLVGVPLMLLAFLLSPLVPFMLTKDEFSQIDHLLQVIFIGYPATCLFMLNISVLFGASKQTYPLILLTSLAAVQVAINFGLQSRFGIQGAAYSLVVFSIVAACVSTVFLLKRYVVSQGWQKRIQGPLFFYGGVAAGIVLMGVLGVPMSLQYLIIAGLLIGYCLVVWKSKDRYLSGDLKVSFS